ncbi:hypothetical protein V6Z12_D06G212100 [Gossypium hirsutum]
MHRTWVSHMLNEKMDFCSHITYFIALKMSKKLVLKIKYLS